MRGLEVTTLSTQYVSDITASRGNGVAVVNHQAIITMVQLWVQLWLGTSNFTCMAWDGVCTSVDGTRHSCHKEHRAEHSGGNHVEFKVGAKNCRQ